MLVRVLGAVRLVDGEGIIEIARRMERRALSVLAAFGDRTSSVDTLIDVLWGAQPPRSARKTLQTDVLRLRRLLGPDVITSVAGGYRLGAGIEVDVDRFEAAVAAARRSPDLAAWHDALAWWSGDPFVELAGWPPIEPRCARLYELCALAHEGYAESLVENDPCVAIGELERLVGEEPMREVRWTLLVRTLLAAGRRPEALRAYDRARRTLALELGIGPGTELEAAHDAALGVNQAVRSAYGDDRIAHADRLSAEAVVAFARGEVGTATASYVQAAELAREAGDIRRFAEAALSAVGDGVRVGLDATDTVIGLLREAVSRVPAGPTPLRARLLARLAVAQSQFTSPRECAALARTSLAIATAIDDPSLVATALHALIYSTPDPLAHAERSALIDQLAELADAHPAERWIRWVLPLEARHRLLIGDVDGALARLGRSAGLARSDGDVVSAHPANYRLVLAATVAGDWDEARAAAAAVRASSNAALFDEATGAVAYSSMLRVFGMLERSAPPPPRMAMEWPTPEMDATASAFAAVSSAHGGQLDDANAALDRLATLLPTITRDAYWLATLSMVAEASHRCTHGLSAEVAYTLLEPAVELTITDPGLIYRGSAAHFAGLAAAAIGRDPTARQLLLEGLRTHERHGSPWMAARSRAAIGRGT
ncbi:MAG TPA: BTAD domain-containing putative transcriptional regulator [Acidimicrobiia bacterium]|nr:BTAD domain-containing putative transcriptional regulator [Acidimicrobiia bacterium]